VYIAEASSYVDVLKEVDQKGTVVLALYLGIQLDHHVHGRDGELDSHIYLRLAVGQQGV